MSRTQRLAEPENFGRYQLISRLAHGRMGDVYKAKSLGVEGFERILVIKTLHPALAAVEGFVDVVIEEAQRAVVLSHANVVQVLDLGQEDTLQQVYIATEYVNGLDLARARDLAVRTQTPWPFELSMFIAAEIANGLDYAHRRKDYNFNLLNLVHRNLTPYNVMLSIEGDVKISDFGISRALDRIPPIDDEERKRRILYSAPEVVRGEPYGQSCDVFSLGVILYELLTGTHPYADHTVEAMFQRAAHGAITPLSQHPALPRPVTQLIEGMLAADPNARISSAGQVYEELVGFIFGNNLKMDARNIAMLIQDLRQDEQRLFPETSPSDAGLDEISLSELQIPDQARSFFDKDEPPRELSDATREALRQADSPDAPGAALPGALEDYFKATRAGRGKAVIVSGQLGAGRDYLPDRLIDALSLRANTLSCAVQLTREDQHRPFGALGDALLEAVRGQLPEGPSARASALALFGTLDLHKEVLDTLAHLWGLGASTRVGTLRKQHSLALLVGAVLRHLCRRGVVVVLLDRVEHLDTLSMEVLRQLIGSIGELPAMVILSTTHPEPLREALDTGNPEHLGAVRVVGSEPPRLRDIPALDEDASSLLALLGVAQQPITQFELGHMLRLPPDRVIAGLRQLVELGLVRVPRTGVFLVARTDVPIWVTERFGREGLRQWAELLVRAYTQRADAARDVSKAPLMMRLHAATGSSREVASSAKRYASWLKREGYFGIALSFHRRVADLMASGELSAPKLQIDHTLERAELALELARVEECRAALAPLPALCEHMRYERGVVLSYLLTGQMLMHQDDLDEARKCFSRAARIAQTSRSSELMMRVQVALSGYYERHGDVRAQREALESAMHLLKRWESPEAERRARGVLLTRAALFWTTPRTMRRGQALLGELRQLADSSGLATLECRTDWCQSRVLVARGDLAGARGLLRRAEAHARDYGLHALAIEIIRQHASTAMEQEDWRGALNVLDDLLELAAQHQDLYSAQRAGDMRALALAMLGGDAREAREHLVRSLARAMQRAVPKDIYRCNALLAQLSRHTMDPRAAHHYGEISARMARQVAMF